HCHRRLGSTHTFLHVLGITLRSVEPTGDRPICSTALYSEAREDADSEDEAEEDDVPELLSSPPPHTYGNKIVIHAEKPYFRPAQSASRERVSSGYRPGHRRPAQPELTPSLSRQTRGGPSGHRSLPDQMYTPAAQRC
ncbi:hypothetical protein JOQ06_007234, partial [Pogonophryne albipinna]